MEIGIVGGGITGLTTALALNKVRLPCRVFERFEKLGDVGAGIWMAPNAMKVFNWLGIGDEIRRAGVQLQSVEITDKNLKPHRSSQLDFISDSGGGMITSLHRAGLQKILHDHLPSDSVFLGKEYTGHQESGDKIDIRFKDGKAQADVLLGADGINSIIRELLFPDSRIRYSGQTCWRGVSDIALPEHLQSSCREAWGPATRFGFSAIGPNRVYWFAVIKAPRGERDQGNLKERLQEIFHDFHPQVKEIIGNTNEKEIIRNDIIDLKPMQLWHSGRTCLLGDAGHATTPNMGQGGAQGVEDAYYIANILSRVPDVNDAFLRFELLRRKKVNMIVRNSWMFGKLVHSRAGQPLLKLMGKLTPDRVIARQMRELYNVNSFDS